ncbi:MAG: tRNA (N6-isopentenyl adenosine(37)-C2)-methylthiotransferase MiaB [Sphingomonadales bacterium]
MKKAFHIKTYGCQMNVYDSERMHEALKAKGYEPVETMEAADLVILNTCHIREKAAEKVYSDIGRIRLLPDERDNPETQRMIAVAGCVAQAEGEEIMRRAKAVNLVVGPQTYHRLPKMLDEAHAQAKKGGRIRVLDTDFPEDSKFDHLPKAQSAAAPAAFLTIQEGCDKFCTFCVVPYTRGAEVSRPVADIIAEAEDMVARGARDITLLGQNVNAYHGALDDGAPITLAGLIRRLNQIKGLERIRYTTSHPRDMDDELIRVHGEVEACQPYLHLPIQSGSNKILEAMNRRHSREHYFDIIERLRAARPDIALSSDIIVGFPGETDEDFEDTMDLVRRVKYAQCYSFKYSPRPGTPAAEMGEQVDENVKADRLARLQALLSEQALEFNQDCVGRSFDVLVERKGRGENRWVGRSPYMQAVHFTLDEKLGKAYDSPIGAKVRVKITQAGPNSLSGDVDQLAD